MLAARLTNPIMNQPNTGIMLPRTLIEHVLLCPLPRVWENSNNVNNEQKKTRALC